MLLYKRLGYANRVYLAHDVEKRRNQEKGSKIRIRKPGTFTAQSVDNPVASDVTIQDIKTSELEIELTEWEDVTTQVPDQDWQKAGNTLVSEHIAPISFALADAIEVFLTNKYPYFPWYQWDATGQGAPGFDDTTVPAQLTYDLLVDSNTTLMENKVPDNDLHLMISPAGKGALLKEDAFKQHSGAGPLGVRTQVTGNLGMKVGYDIFSTHNVVTHTTTPISIETNGVSSLQFNGAGTEGDTAVNLDNGGTAVTGTISAGDTFRIAGSNQMYGVIEDEAAVTNAFPEVKIFPALPADVSDGTAVTLYQIGGKVNLAFHRQHLALVFGSLPRHQGVGANIATAINEFNGMAVRSTIGYEMLKKRLLVSMDELFGGEALNDLMACRILTQQ